MGWKIESWPSVEQTDNRRRRCPRPQGVQLGRAEGRRRHGGPAVPHQQRHRGHAQQHGGHEGLRGGEGRQAGTGLSVMAGITCRDGDFGFSGLQTDLECSQRSDQTIQIVDQDLPGQGSNYF